MSFYLTVRGSCLYSTETIIITPGSTSADQLYAVKDPLSSLNITNFTESSAYCAAQDIVYSFAVSTNPAGLPTSFITFNTTSRIVAWFTDQY